MKHFLLKIGKNFKWRLGTFIGNNAFLFPLLRMHTTLGPLVASEETDICIEGFQRSANSFFTAIFHRWNPEIKIAHHIHMAGQVIHALNKSIPIILLIRKPENSITSLIVMDERLDTSTAVKSYITFYKKILPYKEEIVICDFNEVITRPDNVIKKVNEFYGVSFKSKAYTQVEKNIIFEQNTQFNKLKGYPETFLTIPSQIKDKRQKIIKQIVLNNKYFSEAQKCYNEIAL